MSSHFGQAQIANANAPTASKYIAGATENETAPPVNCAGAELDVALAFAELPEPVPPEPVPPALSPSSVKLAQVMRVAFPK